MSGAQTADTHEDFLRFYEKEKEGLKGDVAYEDLHFKIHIIFTESETGEASYFITAYQFPRHKIADALEKYSFAEIVDRLPLDEEEGRLERPYKVFRMSDGRVVFDGGVIASMDYNPRGVIVMPERMIKLHFENDAQAAFSRVMALFLGADRHVISMGVLLHLPCSGTAHGGFPVILLCRAAQPVSKIVEADV